MRVKEFRLHGPPGTGKTRALSDRWVPAAAEKFGARNVVICSLTRTAAAEIGSRGLPIPPENVGTLHALAYRSLGRPTVAEGEIADWNEKHPLYRLSGATPSVDVPELGRPERGTKADELMAYAQVYRHQRKPLSEWRDDVRVFHSKWKAWMVESGLTDFTGLIEDALDWVPRAPGDPAVFVVDEAQDCSVLELDLVRKWSQSAEYVVLAGDGDQAIYGWRGASARAFLQAGIPEEHNYHLTQSFRVPRKVHALASRWIESASYRYAVNYEPRDFEGEVTTSRGNAKNIEPLIAEAVAEADSGKSVMILGTCGYMLSSALAVLRKQGVPFHNPFRPTQGAWNPLRGGRGRLLAYLRRHEPTFADEARMWTWGEAATWVEIIQARNVLAPSGKTMIRQQANEPSREHKLIEQGDGRACFGNSWGELDTVFAEGDPLAWIEERLLGSKRKSLQYPIEIAKRRGAKTLVETPKICVGTIHSVKGGQADTVFLLPDLSPSGIREWTTPGEGRDSIIRTMYVGMTRAKEKLVLAGRWSARSIDWRLS